MGRKTHNRQRREESLSRDRIIQAAIELLDSNGESGLTFRSLAQRLATGSGAIYWHIASKDELLITACDAIVARTLYTPTADATPQAIIRALALGIFDAIDRHPWVGSTLARAPAQLAVIRMLDRVGQQVRVLGVPAEEQWATVCALLNYILGVGGQNAANGQFAKTQGTTRTDFLDAMAATWSQLDPDEYPFASSVAGQLRSHDDRMDFLAGIDLILKGIGS
jgi:AcrR family transcriptional regulator